MSVCSVVPFRIPSREVRLQNTASRVKTPDRIAASQFRRITMQIPNTSGTAIPAMHRYLVASVMMIPTIWATRLQSGAYSVIAVEEVATPFPPRNFLQQGKSCPSVQPSPAYRVTMRPVPRKSSLQMTMARMHLLISPRRTRRPSLKGRL